jgi:cardiolipin synthase
MKDDFLTKTFMPNNFRDMDFVFSSKLGQNPVGSQTYKQMLLLAYRWEQYTKIVKNQPISSDYNISQLKAFNNKATLLINDDEDNALIKLMKTPIPKLKDVATTIDDIEANTSKATNVAFEVFASGPEQNNGPFAKKILQQINKSKKSIRINHMYFHPTTEITKALINAAERGVTIEIITCGRHKTNPKSHLIFGPRNKYNYSYLKNSVKQEYQNNIQVYEFRQTKKTLHKKVIVIDDEFIFAGSSNFGYKSLVSTSDHELNFYARSKAMAKKTLEIFNTDKEYSAPITDFSIPFKELYKTIFHRIFAPLIG